MRIGVPTNDRINVESHFGHCKEFALIDCENGEVKETAFVTSPPHKPGVMPQFLADNRANVILTGGMGQMAVNLFKENDIDVILGATGSIEENVQVYLSGNLESTGSVCEHNHDH
ncbi:MAG: NifB/NifX family molybdenum-iron cluster-binding protein [Spirochaetales bacterium]|nr:NifB/NifX family molybdenum-iron cluster-binding protein [Spirochaetales bacterium]